MNWKKLVSSFFLPPMVLLVLLLPLAVFALVYSFLGLPEGDPLRIGSYVLSFYTLTIWCLRLPGIIRFFRRFRRENPLLRRWFEDVQLRVRVTLGVNALWNTAYAALQLGLGIYYKSTWFYALAGYYGCLGIMRLMLMVYTLSHRDSRDYRRELYHYRRCGWAFLAINLALSARIFMMLAENRLVRHHEIVTITMAAYTFLSLTMAIVNVIKYRKYQSPVFSASKAISLASALVSMLTLESTMLVTFSNETMSPQTQKLFLALSGGGICAIIVAMAVYMLLKANKTMKNLENTYAEQGNL